MILRNLPGSEGRDADLALKCIIGILGDNTLCSLATVDSADGSPHIWTAYYCYTEDLRLFVLTPPQTRHGRQLENDASTAVAVYDSSQPWDSPKRGLQLFGRATPTKGSQTARAFALYLRRYPAVARIAKRPSELTHIDARFYLVTIDRIRLFDEWAFGEEVFVDMEIVR